MLGNADGVSGLSGVGGLSGLNANNVDMAWNRVNVNELTTAQAKAFFAKALTARNATGEGVYIDPQRYQPSSWAIAAVQHAYTVGLHMGTSMETRKTRHELDEFLPTICIALDLCRPSLMSAHADAPTPDWTDWLEQYETARAALHKYCLRTQKVPGPLDDPNGGHDDDKDGDDGGGFINTVRRSLWATPARAYWLGAALSSAFWLAFWLSY